MVSTKDFNPEELKARFNPDGSLLRREQMIMLEMVTELDRICKKYNIQYFLYWGTLLGAIRHNGFIPWDDDLDVAVMRRDYKKLLKVLPRELPNHIVLQSNDTDKNYFYHFAKLRNTRSYIDEGNYDRYFKERGIFIDIFPIDKTRCWLHMLSEPLHGHCFKILRTSKDNEASMRKVRVITWINRHVSFPVLRFIAKVSFGKSVMCDYGIPLHIAHDMDDLFPTVTHLFEGVPANSHLILQQLYGDYMQLPDLSSITGHVQKIEFYDE